MVQYAYFSILLLAKRGEHPNMIRRHGIKEVVILLNGAQEYMDGEITTENMFLSFEVDQPFQVLVRWDELLEVAIFRELDVGDFHGRGWYQFSNRRHVLGWRCLLVHHL